MTDSISIIRRFKEGRNQAEYAEFLGVTQGYLSRVLAGDRGPNLVLLRLIAKYPQHAAEIAATLPATPTAPERDPAPVPA